MYKAEKVGAALKTCVPSKCKADEITKFEPTLTLLAWISDLRLFHLVPSTKFSKLRDIL